jgi:hypothetical protein
LCGRMGRGKEGGERRRSTETGRVWEGAITEAKRTYIRKKTRLPLEAWVGKHPPSPPWLFTKQDSSRLPPSASFLSIFIHAS